MSDMHALTSPANAMCPLYPDERTDPSIFVLYHGARVGLCCKECKWEWDVLTDEEKQDYVKESQPGSSALAIAHENGVE